MITPLSFWDANRYSERTYELYDMVSSCVLFMILDMIYCITVGWSANHAITRNYLSHALHKLIHINFCTWNGRELLLARKHRGKTVNHMNCVTQKQVLVCCHTISHLYRSDALVPQGKTKVKKDHWWQWYSNLWMCIIVIDRFFSILASSCGTTMADFIGPYGVHALKTCKRSL